MTWRNRIIERKSMRVGDLVVNPHNPKIHTSLQDARLRAVLNRFGIVDNLIAYYSERNGGELTLFDGHERRGLDPEQTWDIAITDLTDTEVDELVLLFDPLAGMVEYDREVVGALMQRITVTDEPLVKMLAEQAEAWGVVNDNGQAGQDTQPPEVTQIEAEKYHERWQVQPGDVWQLGEHIIACLDSLEVENIKRLTDGIEISGIFADPPYGINIVAANGYVGGGEAYDIPFGGVKSSHRRRIPVGGGSRHKDLIGKYYIEEPKAKRLGSSYGAKPFGKEKKIAGSDGASNLIEVGKYYPVIGDDTPDTAKKAALFYLELFPKACQIWWGANYYTDILSPSPCWLIWDKDNTGNFADCEMAWTNQPTAARIFKHRWNGMLKASEQGQRRIHPTQKPVALAQWCLENYGQAGDVIIDPFLGSGITVLAAQQLGDRKVIGFELEPVYISVVCQRFLDYTGIQPQRVSQ